MTGKNLEGKIRLRIAQIQADYSHVLEGDLSDIQDNAPRALMQLDAEARLNELYNLIGEKYKSKLVKYERVAK